jgi:hypothetical protein
MYLLSIHLFAIKTKMCNIKIFIYTNFFVQFFREHLIIALLLQLIQEIKDLFAGQERHLIEHFSHIIFLHILQNLEQFIHMIF